MSAASKRVAAKGVAPKRVAVVDRAARLLAAFAPDAPDLTLPQAAARLGIPKPTAFRILTTLARHGLVDHDAAAAVYRLGFASQRLADALLQGVEIRARAKPVMQDIRDAVNETVILSIRDGDDRINVDCVESAQAIAPTLQLGVRAPLYAGAASHVFLAAMSDAEIDAYLARTRLVAFGASTLVEPAKIRQRVRAVRADGHAVSFGEFTATPGSNAVAVPVRDAAGATVAALHVSGPKGRMTPALRDACLKALTAGAARLRG